LFFFICLDSMTTTADKKDDDNSCCICYDPIGICARFGPCGHEQFCWGCALRLALGTNEMRCPLCRDTVNVIHIGPNQPFSSLPPVEIEAPVVVCDEPDDDEVPPLLVDTSQVRCRVDVSALRSFAIASTPL
jgi:Zinc finger, C3HC4 type (RING finger)